MAVVVMLATPSEATMVQARTTAMDVPLTPLNSYQPATLVRAYRLAALPRPTQRVHPTGATAGLASKLLGRLAGQWMQTSG